MAGDFSQLTPNNNQGLVKAAEGCSTTMASIGLYVRTFNAHDKKNKIIDFKDQGQEKFIEGFEFYSQRMYYTWVDLSGI